MSSPQLFLLNYQSYQSLLCIIMGCLRTKTEERMAKDWWRMVFSSNRREKLFMKTSTRFDLCWLVLTRAGLVFIRVDSCRTCVDSCWLVSDSCWFVLIHVDLCWHSCIRIDLIQNVLHMKKRLHARKTTRGFLKTKKKSRIDYQCIFILPLRSAGINQRLQNFLNFSHLPRFYHYHYSLHTIEYFSSIFFAKG